MYANIIFDLDDTILKCGIYYDNAKNEFVEYSHRRTDIPKNIILNILNGIDVACTELPHGFNKERFPRSFAATSLTLDAIRGKDIDRLAESGSYLIGKAVFYEPYEMFEGIRDILVKYKSSGRRLFLCTKGDTEVQQRKIDIHNLYDIFDPENVYIVKKKNTEKVLEILTEHQLEPSGTVFVGDSLRDDVGSALGAGIDAVWINSKNRIHWSYENNSGHNPTYTIESLRELPTIIPF